MGTLRFIKPINTIKINSPYQKNRKHPVTGEIKLHSGIDYYADEGDPILASESGIVIRAARSDATGNTIIIHHTPRWQR